MRLDRESEQAIARDDRSQRVASMLGFVLFVRQTNKVAGRAPAYVFLGPCTRAEDQGERPIQITWKLHHPMPERWFRVARAVAG